MPASAETHESTPEPFSLVVGGPIYDLLLRLGLVTPALERIGWRIFLISMLAWAPLVVLSIMEGHFFAGVQIPFLHDFEVHVRLLVFVPLLMAGEVTIHRGMSAIVSQFRERRIVTEATEERFEKYFASAHRLRNSKAIELGLVTLIFVAAALGLRVLTEIQSDTWYATISAHDKIRTAAGSWYQSVSVPICQILMIRWYFRLFVWARFLWQVSRLKLNLIPTHPDGSCGLGFLDSLVFALSPFLLAHSCLVSGVLANLLLYGGGKLPDHYVEIGAMASFLCLVTLAPLCLFTGPMVRARLAGLRVYGRLASEYVNSFDRKWIGGERPPEEALVGSADIQSLADLANSFAIVKSVIPFPFGRGSLVALAVLIVLPLLPLGLTMFSLQELLLRLVRIVL